MTQIAKPELEAIEADLLERIDEQGLAGHTPNVVRVVQLSSSHYAPSLVRRAYWQLVSNGEIAADAAGNIRRVGRA